MVSLAVLSLVLELPRVTFDLSLCRVSDVIACFALECVDHYLPHDKYISFGGILLKDLLKENATNRDVILSQGKVDQRLLIRFPRDNIGSGMSSFSHILQQPSHMNSRFCFILAPTRINGTQHFFCRCCIAMTYAWISLESMLLTSLSISTRLALEFGFNYRSISYVACAVDSSKSSIKLWHIVLSKNICMF